MKNAGIQFQANDSKYNNGEENKKSDLKQRGHGFSIWISAPLEDLGKEMESLTSCRQARE